MNATWRGTSRSPARPVAGATAQFHRVLARARADNGPPALAPHLTAGHRNPAQRPQILHCLADDTDVADHGWSITEPTLDCPAIPCAIVQPPAAGFPLWHLPESIRHPAASPAGVLARAYSPPQFNYAPDRGARDLAQEGAAHVILRNLLLTEAADTRNTTPQHADQHAMLGGCTLNNRPPPHPRLVAVRSMPYAPAGAGATGSTGPLAPLASHRRAAPAGRHTDSPIGVSASAPERTEPQP